MSEPNDKDFEVYDAIIRHDAGLAAVADYREECVKAERERVLAEVEKTAASFYDRNQCGGHGAWFDASEELRARIAKLRSEP
jgi:hypothetical protein